MYHVIRWTSAVLVASIVFAASAPAAAAEDDAQKTDKEKSEKTPQSVLDFSLKDIDGESVDLEKYKGKVLMLVNVASECGLTNAQYKGLEALHAKYEKKGFTVLAFPANNFGAQEPGTNKEIKAFCAEKRVTFPVFAKISVKGDDIDPLYSFLTAKETGGEFSGTIRWNFQKFLVSRDGKVIARFEPSADPLSEEVTAKVEKALAEKAPESAGKGEKAAKNAEPAKKDK